MNEVNRYGESHVKPAKGILIIDPAAEDEFGMHRSEVAEDVDWSHDPRSEAAHEFKHSVYYATKDFPTDEILEDQLRDALGTAMADEGSGINLTVKDGIVKLTGIVGSRERKQEAQQIIERFSELSDVFNQLQVTDKV